MAELFELIERPDLDAPVLVLALDGWIDAGLGAATARSALLGQGGFETVARFDTDALLDYRARRPTMHLEDGVNTGLSWPSIELRAGRDRDGNDVLVLAGAEPDHLWHRFSRAVVDLAVELGVRLVTGLGAYPAPVPHTRPCRVVATATSPELARTVGFVPGRIDVPSGIHAPIEIRCAEVGLPAVGLWAQVPHYAAAMPYPAAAAALIEALARVSGARFEQGTLPDDAAMTRVRIDELVANSPEHQAMVQALEQQVDGELNGGLDTGGMTLLSADELAAEVERFLREQGS